MLSFLFSGKDKDKKDLLEKIQEYEKDQECSLFFLVDCFWENFPKDKQIYNTPLRHHVMEIDDHDLFMERINTIALDPEKKNQRLEIVFNTHGGSVESSDILANVLMNYPQPIYCYVPILSQSAGTLLALTADKLFMNFYSVLGPVDPQLTYQGQDTDFDDTSSRCLLELNERKDASDISDTILVKIIESEFLHEDGEETMKQILSIKRPDMKGDQVDHLCDFLCSGKYPHHKPINRALLTKMGVEIAGDVPERVNKLFNDLIDYSHEQRSS